MEICGNVWKSIHYVENFFRRISGYVCASYAFKYHKTKLLPQKNFMIFSIFIHTFAVPKSAKILRLAV